MTVFAVSIIPNDPAPMTTAEMIGRAEHAFTARGLRASDFRCEYEAANDLFGYFSVEGAGVQQLEREADEYSKTHELDGLTGDSLPLDGAGVKVYIHGVRDF